MTALPQSVRDRAESALAMAMHRAKISIHDRECMRVAKDALPDVVAIILEAVRAGEIKP